MRVIINIQGKIGRRKIWRTVFDKERNVSAGEVMNKWVIAD